MFFSNAEVPLSETDKAERRLRADLAASFQARVLLGAFPIILNQVTILFNLPLWILWFDYLISSHLFIIAVKANQRGTNECFRAFYTEGGYTSSRGQMPQSVGMGAQDRSFSSVSCELSFLSVALNFTTSKCLCQASDYVQIQGRDCLQTCGTKC